MLEPKKLFKSLVKKCGSKTIAGRIIRKDIIPILEKQYKDLQPFGIDYRSKREWEEKGKELKETVKALKILGLPENKTQNKNKPIK